MFRRFSAVKYQILDTLNIHPNEFDTRFSSFEPIVQVMTSNDWVTNKSKKQMDVVPYAIFGT